MPLLPASWHLPGGYLLGPGANLTSANLAGMDLTGIDLTGANLTSANLAGANLTGIDLTGANLTSANLANTNLTGIDLTGANLTGANLTSANLAGMDLTGIDLTGANLTSANLANTNLTGIDLTGANLTGANLTSANLANTNLTGADLTGAGLTGANLTGATLTDATLTSANLTGATLTGATLTGLSLAGVTLTNATLTGADLTGATLTGADLTGADLTGATLTGATLTGAILTGVFSDPSAAPRSAHTGSASLQRLDTGTLDATFNARQSQGDAAGTKAAQAELATRTMVSGGMPLGDPTHVDVPKTTVSFARGLVIQAWVLPRTLVDNTLIFELGEISLRAMANGTVELQWTDDKGTKHTVIAAATVDSTTLNILSSKVLTLGEWTHVTASLSKDGGVRFFVDGVETTSVHKGNGGAAAVSERTTLQANANVEQGSRFWAQQSGVPIDPATPAKDALNAFLSGLHKPGTSVSDALPADVSQRLCKIGRGKVGNTSVVLNVGDVRLWNRGVDVERIVDLTMRKLRGHEVGLIGWWPLDAANGLRDLSPFGLHGRLVGAARAGEPLPGFRIGTMAEKAYACVLGKAESSIQASSLHVAGPGLTWQAWVALSEVGTHSLLRVVHPNQRGLPRAQQVSTFYVHMAADKTLVAGMGSNYQTRGPKLQVGAGVSVAVRLDPSGVVSFFVDGKLVGTQGLMLDQAKAPMPSGHSAAQFDAQTFDVYLGEGIFGFMQEVRLWGRALGNDEVLETTERRVHGWAPDLIAYLRHDNEALPTVMVNEVTGSSAVLATAGLMVTRGHDLAAPPAVAHVVARPHQTAGLTLPETHDIGPSGLTVQLWFSITPVSSRHLLSFYDPNAGGDKLSNLWPSAWPKFIVDLYNYELHFRYKVTTSFTGTTVKSDVIKAGVWVHLTVTISDSGLACVYLNGALAWTYECQGPMAGRNPEKPGTFWVLGGGTEDLFTELRVYDRALESSEIKENWYRRVVSQPNLVSRWALDGHPEEIQGMVGADQVTWLSAQPFWTERKHEAKTRATVAGFAELIADPIHTRGVVPNQSWTMPVVPGSPEMDAWVNAWIAWSFFKENGTKPADIQFTYPRLAIDLTALDDRGQPLPGKIVTVVLSGAADLYKNTATSPNKITPDATRAFPLTMDSRGKARLLLNVSGLLAPIFYMRHDGMPADEWSVFTPDQAIHKALVGLTGDELERGRRATATTKAGKAGLVTKDGARLATVLRRMLGDGESTTFEAQTTAALAFNEDEAPAAPAPQTPIYAAPGAANYSLPDGLTLVRRWRPPPGTLLTATGGPDPGMPVAFFGWDDFTGAIETGFNAVVEVGEKVVTFTKKVVTTAVATAVEVIEVSVNAVIDTVTLVLRKVIPNFDDLVDFVTDILVQIGKSIMKVLSFLIPDFDWSGFLQTSDFLLDQLNEAIGGAELATGSIVADTLQDFSKIRTLLGPVSSPAAALPAAAAQVASTASTAMSQLGGPFEWLLSQLAEAQEPLFESLRAPITSIFSGLAADVKTLIETTSKAAGEKLVRIVALIVNPASLVEGDLLKLVRDIGGELIGIALDLTEGALKVVKALASRLFQTLRDVLTMAIPLDERISWLLKTFVLEGRSLTVGRVLCLVPAIPLTLAYKRVTGTSSCPFETTKVVDFLAPGAPGATSDLVTFADSGTVSPAKTNLALRAVDTFVLGLTGWLSYLDTLTKTDDTYRYNVPLHAARWMAQTLILAVRKNPHIVAALERRAIDANGKVSMALGYAGYGAGLAAQLLTAYHIHYDATAAAPVGTRRGPQVLQGLSAALAALAFIMEDRSGQGGVQWNPTTNLSMDYTLKPNLSQQASRLKMYDTTGLVAGLAATAAGSAPGGPAAANTVAALYGVAVASSAAATADLIATR